MGVNSGHSWRECASALAIAAGVYGVPVVIAPAPAFAACSISGSGYEITAQNSTVNLDTDCTGASTNAATVTGDVDGVGNSGINDAPGGAGNWSVTINNGVTVSGSDGMLFESAGASVDNSGTVASTDAEGIQITASGGVVTNRASGAINARKDGVEFDGASGTVNNYGDITSADDNGVTMRDGGTVTNFATGTISGDFDGVHIRGGTGIVTNSGQITGDSDESGVQLDMGGTVTNNAGGTITGDAEGINIDGAPGEVINSGTITGATNFGVIMRDGGSVTNHAGGLIKGDNGLAGVSIRGGTGTIDNAGILRGNDDEGVELTAGGTIINRAGGLIEGEADEAIQISGGAGSVTNAGRIESINGGPTVLFDGFDDRFEIQPGSLVTNATTFPNAVNPGIVQAAGGTDTLAFGGTGTQTFDISTVDGNNTAGAGEQYLNFETFVKEDASTFNFTGTNTEIGAFAVNGGLLNVNGNMGSTAFSVNGGTLGGSGTVGGTAITGGTVAPGNSIGTLTVNGALNLGAGSIYAVEVDAAGNSDLIDVTGTVTLGGGTLSVLATGGGTYGPSTDYIIIANDGVDAVAGTFGTITTDLAFLKATVNYAGGTGNDVALNLTQVATFTSVAGTFNQTQSATGLAGLDQTAGSDSLTVYNAILGLTADQARSAFDSASGEVHASSQHMSTASFDLYRRTLNELAKAGVAGSQVAQPANPTAYARKAKPASASTAIAAFGYADAMAKRRDRADARVKAAWVAPLGGAGQIAGDGNAAPFGWWTAGIATGFQGHGYAGSGHFVAGISAGYLHGGGVAAARSSTVSTDSLNLGAYGAWSNGEWTLSGSAAYAATGMNTSRTVTVGGLTRTATASYWTHALGITAEAARNIDFGSVTLSPLATIDAGWAGHGDATETGAGALSLTLAPESRFRLDTGLGIALAKRFTTRSNRKVTLHARAVWEHSFASTTPDQAMAFAGSPTAFTVQGAALGRDRLRVGLGFGIKSGRTTVSAGYDGTFFGGHNRHAANANVTVSF